jgi:hypothetical protein
MFDELATACESARGGDVLRSVMSCPETVTSIDRLRTRVLRIITELQK